MQEIELKLRYSPSEEAKVIAYCTQNGYTPLAPETQEDYYLTPSHRNLYRQDTALRVRHVRVGGAESWAVTYKGSNSDKDFHSRREVETSIADGGALLEILRLLDFQDVLAVKKERRSYVREDMTISLDCVQGAGCFVEIELLCDGEQVDAKAKIQKTLDEMELLSAVVEKRNYLQLVAESYGSGSGPA